jgi:hypothetical protein
VVCYDVDLLDMYRRSAGLVDRNQRAARQLGLSLPSALLVRADRVIE